MSAARAPFEVILNQLEKYYGRPRPSKVSDPLQMILLENVAYLVSDDQREKAFKALHDRIGLDPVRILSAPESDLLEVARLGGMLPEGRVKKLRSIAQMALREFQGDLKKVLKLPLAQAKRSLK